MRKLLLLILSAWALITSGQTHQWAFDLRTGVNGIANITCLTVDDSSNVYVGGIFLDSLFIGNDTLYFRNGNVRAIFIAKYNADGDFIWVKQISSARGARLKQLAFNKKGELILYGDYSTNGTTGIEFGKFTLIRGSAVFLAWMDRNGTFTDARDIAYGFYCQAESLEIGPDGELHAAMYLNGFGSGYRLINGTGTVAGSGYTYALAKYSSDAKALRWHHFLSTGAVSGIFSVSVDRDKQVYAAVRSNLNQTIFGTSVGSTNPNFLLWFRPDGTFHKKIQTAAINSTNLLNDVVALDSSRIYLAGSSRNDSFQIGGSKIYAPSSRPNSSFYFVAELQDFDTLSWYVSSSQQWSGSEGDCRLSLNGDFLYFSSLLNSNGYTFGGFSTSGFVESIVSKIDRLGNVLWYLPIPSGRPPLLSPIGEQDLVYSGSFTKPVRLTPFNLPNKNFREQPFLARTFDYSITRGPVRQGPYCAGDTLLVPFKRSGTYDTSNFFIAELSDANGNFITNFRELGRLKAQTDTTIVGLLPLFKVVSSNKYRIRIRSTNPAVQSYYLLDTLNLLIYSTDKADPGPDRSICLGDTLQLETFGGTRWKWWPAYNMDDSTSRTPLIWPRVDTTYTIAISDSSGCGLPDTASIRIQVLNGPQFRNISYPDSIACFGDKIAFQAELSGGNGTIYVWQIDERDRILGRIPSDSNRVKLDFPFSGDTLIRLIFTDSCSEKVDSAAFTVRTPVPAAYAVPSDTVLCYGRELAIEVQSIAYRIDSISWAWVRRSDQKVISLDSTLLQTFNTTDSIWIIRQDRCVNLTDTSGFRVDVYPTIQTLVGGINDGDSLCYGQDLELLALVSGGDPTAAKTNLWHISNQTFRGDTIRFSTNSIAYTDSINVQLVSSDGCTSVPDTADLVVYLNPPLQFSFNHTPDSILCANKGLLLKARYTGGVPGASISFIWQGDRVFQSDADSLFVPFDSFGFGLHRIALSGFDGCSMGDTVFHTFRKPMPLNSSIQVSPMIARYCVQDNVILNVKPAGGLGRNYRQSWYVHDSLYSNTDSLALRARSQSGKTSVEVRYVLDDGCSEVWSDTLTLNFYPETVISLIGDSTVRSQQARFELCQGEKLMLVPRVYHARSALDSLIDWYQDGVYLGRSIRKEFIAPAGGLSSQIQAITTNDCSSIQDTLFVELFGRDALQITLPSDTVVCLGSDLRVRTRADGGLGSNHNVLWTDDLDASFAAAGVVLDILNIRRSMRLRAILTDSCSVPDSAYISVDVLPALSIDLFADSICADGPIDLTTNASGGLETDHRFRWLANDQLLSDTEPDLSYRANGIERIAVVLTDGCSSDPDTAIVDIASKPRFTVSGVPEEICAPYIPGWAIKAVGAGVLDYNLINETLGEQRPYPWTTALDAGNYVWKIKSRNALGCSDSMTIQMDVLPRPSAVFRLDPLKPELTFLNVVCLAEEENADLYTWYVNGEIRGSERNFLTTPTEPGIYTIGLRVALNGCADSSETSFTVRDAIGYNGINAFSPNQDGVNDLYLPSLSGVSSFDFSIYNRWGQKVFSGNESKGWDGTYLGAPVISGAYKVLITAKNVSGIRSYYEGVLQVVR